MFDHMAGVMRAVAKKNTLWKEDLIFAVNLAWQKLSNFYAEVSPMTGICRISAHILDPFCKLQTYRQWDKVIDINPEDETSYTTQYPVADLKYVQSKYCAKH
jgi:hypothetical protein